MFKFNPIPKFGLLGLVLPLVYLLAISWQDRAKDFGLTGEEMYWPEKLFMLVCVAPVLATWLLGIYRAHLAGSWRWFLGCFICWPLSFVHALLINQGDAP